jgi:8-oxo-dGTP pyrophosphatase MutT (NUDIX family)
VQLIKSKAELLEHLARVGYSKVNYRIAVEALIFTHEGKLLLEERGPEARDEIGKLEGVGGRLNGNDLLRELWEEIDQELAAQRQRLEVAIERVLEVRQVQFDERDRGVQDWVVVSHLCRIIRGKPAIGEPGKVEALHEVRLAELYALDEAKLSNSTIAARRTYKAWYGDRPYYEVPDPNP